MKNFQNYQIAPPSQSLEKHAEKGTSGFSLIELIIVAALLGTAFFALLGVFTRSAETRAEAEIRTIQSTLLNDLMNTIQSTRFDEYLAEDWSSTLGSEEDLGVPFDDVDDFDGWNESAVTDYPLFSRTVTVNYVDVAGDLQSAVTGPTDYKLVTITIGHKTMSDLVDKRVITPGIPPYPASNPLCLAEGLELNNIYTNKKVTFTGPFPRRQMTFTVDGGTGTFTVDCTACLSLGDTNGSLAITKIFDSSGDIATACGG